MYNTLKSPLDQRDYIFENRKPRDIPISLPVSIDLTSRLNKCRDQKSRGTCAAFAGSCCLEFQENKNVGSNDYFSPEFIYDNRQGAPNGSGMFGRDVMEILLRKGCVPDFMFPYKSQDTSNPVPQNIMQKALPFVINSYAQVTTIEGLKQALMSNGVAMVCFPVYKARPNFWHAEVGEQATGGHAVCVVGYDDNKKTFTIRNSWGTTWNGNGYVEWPYSDFGSQWELWTIVSHNLTPVPNSPPVCCGSYCEIL